MMRVPLQPGKDIFPGQEWKANRNLCILYTRKQSKKHGNLTRILVLLDSLLDYIRDATEHLALGILERAFRESASISCCPKLERACSLLNRSATTLVEHAGARDPFKDLHEYMP